MRTIRGCTAKPTSTKSPASIRQWGWTNPALVDKNGTLIAGIGRVAAAAKLKLTSIPVIGR
jgi:ParB-like chromosome segregation protein Spo0J